VQSAACIPSPIKKALKVIYNMDAADNDIYIMIITVTVVLLILLIFIVSFLFIYKNRQMRHQTEIESVKEKYTQEMLKTELEIKEQTLKNISEEIHDNVGQVLSLAVLNLSAMDFSDSTKAEAKAEHITGLVEKAIIDLRNLSKTLDAENIADLGLSAIIRFELDLLEKTGIYNTSFRVSGEEKRLGAHKELVLYRIIQESLNNIIKHAKATSINIVLDFGKELSVEIADNGVGFDVDDNGIRSIYKNGAGIKNMKKRAGLIGLAISIRSAPSCGTTISLSIPVTEN
jgi:two-component system NarL family sensor kinase